MSQDDKMNKEYAISVVSVSQVDVAFIPQKTPPQLELKCSEMVGPDGLEPSTHGLKVRCSTD
jgi:hypothetical protein